MKRFIFCIYFINVINDYLFFVLYLYMRMPRFRTQIAIIPEYCRIRNKHAVPQIIVPISISLYYYYFIVFVFAIEY